MEPQINVFKVPARKATKRKRHYDDDDKDYVPWVIF